ncbi:MAG TPA: DoxX family protein [Candidatus Dormibacteraeota bacterium]|jgi:putative oxidoreductase
MTGLALGLLVLRVGVGLTIAAHGGQKLFGWFGGAGMAGTSAGMTRMRFKPGLLWALVAGLGEFGGGLLLVLGLLSPFGAFALVGAMVVAIISSHLPKGFWNRNGGIEFPLMIGVPALALTFTGAGPVSLDALFKITLPEPATWLVLAAGVTLTVVVALATRRVSDSVGAKAATAP